MEATQIIDAAFADLLVRIGWYAVSVIVTGAVAVIGTLDPQDIRQAIRAESTAAEQI